jgi:Ca-activated chloride channel family protein
MAERESPVEHSDGTVESATPPEKLHENGFRAVAGSPLSTFSIDVDAASYSNVRGYLDRGVMPRPQEVRIEELVNYFDYDYAQPTGEHPFAFATDISDCPWEPRHKLVRVALKGLEIEEEQASASNLVFLIDVSGSMAEPAKLPLLKESFHRLVDQLRPHDRVAIVVYAGSSGLVLEPTPGSEKRTINDAIDRLESGGSTAGGEGIELAYDVAKKSFLKKGNNRVVLATDGDFNIGISDTDGLVKLIETKRDDGIFLSVLGFGYGNYQDGMMEQLADNGNGNYYYIDRLAEAERVLVSGMTSTLHTIAKDVKLQVAFNPATVKAYRLIGYENRVLAARDFDDDTKDAGELGAGHTVTAFYEVVPVGAEVGHAIDDTRADEFALDDARPYDFSANDLLHARLRYKKPEETTSRLIEHVVVDERKSIDATDREFRFAAAVAEWGLLLRGSAYKGSGSYEQIMTLAAAGLGSDRNGARAEFIELVRKSKELDRKGVTTR